MSHEKLQNGLLKKAHEEFEKKLMTSIFTLYSAQNKLEDNQEKFELSRCIYNLINQISHPEENIEDQIELSKGQIYYSKLLVLIEKLEKMGVKEQKEMIGKGKEQLEQYSNDFMNYALDSGILVDEKEKLDQKDHSQQPNIK